MGSSFREQIISRRLGYSARVTQRVLLSACYSARVTQRVMAPSLFRIIGAGLCVICHLNSKRNLALAKFPFVVILNEFSATRMS